MKIPFASLGVLENARRQKAHARVFFVGGLFALVAAVVVVACTPSQIRAVEQASGPATQATCVLLRALTTDGLAQEICATAEELAPYVPELLNARGTSASLPTDGKTTVVAAALSTPQKRVPRRQCIAWQPLGDASTDAGSP